MTTVQTGNSEGAELAVASAAQGVKASSRKGLAELVEQNMAEFESALPPGVMNPERFARIIFTEFRKTPKLLTCTPESFMGALFQTAQLGLEPGGQLGHAFLIPYDTKSKVTKEPITECQLQIGYKGFVELGGRRGLIMRARELREHDDFSFDLGSNEFLSHSWKPGKQRGDIIAYWGKVVYPDGRVTFTVMEMDEIYERRNRSSAYQYEKTHHWAKTPWTTDEAAMCRKTVIRAMVPQVALAPDLQIALRADEAVIERDTTSGALNYRHAIEVSTTDSLPASPTKEDVTQALNAMDQSQMQACATYLRDNFGPIESISDATASACLTIVQEWPAVLNRGMAWTAETWGPDTRAILNELDDELETQADRHLLAWVQENGGEVPADDSVALELERWLNSDPNEPEPADSPAAQSPSEPQNPSAGTDAQGSDPGPTDPQGAAPAANPGGVPDDVLERVQARVNAWEPDTVKRLLREWGEPVSGKLEAQRLRLTMKLAPEVARGNKAATDLF